MKPESLARLEEIRQRIVEIEEFRSTIGSFAEFSSHQMMIRAYERNIEVIGEAVYELLKDDPGIAISNARRIAVTRHKLAHDYDRVSLDILWLIGERDLSILKAEVIKLIR